MHFAIRDNYYERIDENIRQPKKIRKTLNKVLEINETFMNVT